VNCDEAHNPRDELTTNVNVIRARWWRHGDRVLRACVLPEVAVMTSAASAANLCRVG